jgi:hypothetical protein
MRDLGMDVSHKLQMRGGEEQGVNPVGGGRWYRRVDDAEHRFGLYGNNRMPTNEELTEMLPNRTSLPYRYT